jgi:formylglycine-generating enzyme required for sulfatase activity/nucleoside phosphorylase
MHIPFVVLTALDVEFVAVVRQLRMHGSHLSVHNTLFEIGTIDTPAGPLDVAVAEIGAGDANAAAQAALAIQEFSPIAAFFVGVAGGIKDVQIGDVVLATKIYLYESGKEELAEFRTRPDAPTTSWDLQQIGRAVRRNTNWAPNASANDRSFRVHLAPICAGDKVLASTRSRTYKLIRRFYNDAIAVEMEGFGFITPINQRGLPCMVIRGISDLLDKKEDADSGGSQVLGADNAAKVLVDLIGRYVKAGPNSSTESTGKNDRKIANRSPYMGLRYFDIDDGDLYFGREQDIDDVLLGWRAAVARNAGCHMAILGASGAGKSSLLRAGVLRALRNGALPDSGDWPHIVLRPGQRPLLSLAEKLLSLNLPQLSSIGFEQLLERLENDERALAQILGASSVGRVVLAIDQLEELFTLTEFENERAAFLANLTYAANNSSSYLMLLSTLRIDQYDRLAEHLEFANTLSNHVLLGPLTAANTRVAIEQPANSARVSFEAGLIDRLLADASGSGELPLLQHALLELWRRRDGHLLTHSSYVEVGGIAGAMVQRAEAVYGSLSLIEKEACRNLFTRFSIIGQLADLRRPLLLEHAVFGHDLELYRQIVSKFAADDARLLIVSSVSSGGVATVEVAHESLVRNWPRLQRWIDADRDAYQLHQELTAAAQTWHIRNRGEEYLFTGNRLVASANWTHSYADRMDSLERDFIDASLYAELGAVVDSKPQVVESRLEAWWSLGSLATRVARKALTLSVEPDRLVYLKLAALCDTDDDIASEARQLIFAADPLQIRLIISALNRHRLPSREQMWAAVLDARVTDGALIRAASAIASTTGTDPRWKRVASRLTTALLEQSGLAFGEWLLELRPLVDVLSDHLVEVATNPASSEVNRNSAVIALAEFSHSPSILASVLVRLDGHLFDVMVRSVDEASSRDVFVALLKENSRASVSSESEAESRLSRARAAAALVRMDELEDLDTILDNSSSTEIAKILELTADSTSVEVLSRGLHRSQSSNVTRLFLLALASRSRSDFDIELVSEISLTVQSIFSHHRDAAVHAAADLLLRRWEGSSPLAVQNGDIAGKAWECIELEGMKLTLVHFQGSQFAMGSPDGEHRREGDEILHQVRITKSFAMLDRPITVGQLALYRSALGHRIDLKDLSSAAAAVDVSWVEAQEFCLWLNELMAEKDVPEYAGFSFRLPTEAEWEYACRSFSVAPFEFGAAELLPWYGWFEENAEGGPMPVATKFPSSAGLFDMHGNVYEWCLDWYGPYDLVATVDPTGPQSGDRRVVRGGCWFFDSRFCRSAYRGDTRAPEEKYNDLGFRVVLSRPLMDERLSGT